MRIIGGDAKGRPVLFPGKSKARPTADRVKASLFDILSPVRGKTILDVFAGSGNIGLEALSRGAIQAVFIEKETTLVDYIRRNLRQCRFEGNYEVLNMETAKAIPFLQKKEARFDIVFADPPYEAGLVEQTYAWLRDGRLFAEEGILVMQHSVREEPVCAPAGPLVLFDQRRYGDTLLSFLNCQKGN